MSTLFGGVRAPSALGSHLRCYTWGNVAQLEKAGREFLAELARQAPLLPGAGTLASIDIDSMQKRVYGHRKQSARFGHTGFLARPAYEKHVLGRPVHRIVQALAADGFDVAAGTLCGALKQIAPLIAPWAAAIAARSLGRACACR